MLPLDTSQGRVLAVCTLLCCSGAGACRSAQPASLPAPAAAGLAALEAPAPLWGAALLAPAPLARASAAAGGRAGWRQLSRAAACCTTTFSRVFQALQDLHWPDLQGRGRLWVRSAFQQWVAAGGGGGSGVPTLHPRSPLCRLLSASAAHVELFGLRAGAGSAGQHQAAVSWWVWHL